MTAPRRRLAEEGNAALIVLLLLVALIASCALVVDLGNVYRVRGELQTAADSAALAGASRLDSSPGGIARARDAAAEYARENDADRGAVEVLDQDMVFGHWDSESSTFTSLGSFPSAEQAEAVNAVSVLTQRSGARGDPVDAYVAPILGHASTDVGASAIAVGGGPITSECVFPLVVSDCELEEADPGGDCSYCMVFQNNNNDSGGFTTFAQSGQIGNPALAAKIADACFDGNNVVVDADGRCAGSGCGDLMAGAEIGVKNGNILNDGNQACASGRVANCNNPCPLIQRVLTRGGTQPPTRFVVTVPVIGRTGGSCVDQYSGQREVVGFATLEIFGAKCGNNSPAVVVADPPETCEPPPSGDFIGAVLRCDMEPEGHSGGGFYGLQARYMRLVR